MICYYSYGSSSFHLTFKSPETERKNYKELHIHYYDNDDIAVIFVPSFAESIFFHRDEKLKELLNNAREGRELLMVTGCAESVYLPIYNHLCGYYGSKVKDLLTLIYAQ